MYNRGGGNSLVRAFYPFYAKKRHGALVGWGVEAGGQQLFGFLSDFKTNLMIGMRRDQLTGTPSGGLRLPAGVQAIVGTCVKFERNLYVESEFGVVNLTGRRINVPAPGRPSPVWREYAEPQAVVVTAQTQAAFLAHQAQVAQAQAAAQAEAPAEEASAIAAAPPPPLTPLPSLTLAQPPSPSHSPLSSIRSLRSRAPQTNIDLTIDYERDDEEQQVKIESDGEDEDDGDEEEGAPPGKREKREKRDRSSSPLPPITPGSNISAPYTPTSAFFAGTESLESPPQVQASPRLARLTGRRRVRLQSQPGRSASPEY
eukprot:gb/GEZN01005483.1/.p1 GENE.gb/GEZN01005483.1/~~gb/GEZN01005483.1/.p1  ORF type:complete len:314 (+),score=36.64 gb/GEZN01005483.1/:761-1702(+)